MANISTYPIATPKAGDLVTGTQTYDINEANPVVGNPTRNFTVGSVVSSQLPDYINGTINTIPVFTAANKIGDSIITQDVDATTATVTGDLTVTNNMLIGSLGGNLTVENNSDFRGDAVFQGDLLEVSCSMKINYNILDVDNLSGTVGQVLSSTGDTGKVKWIDVATGTVESITALSPLTGGTITTTGDIGITQATTSTDGYLSSTDWNTFNNKSTFDGQYSSLTGAPVLAAVATSGSYNDLLNQPTIPTDNSQLANGAGYTTNLGTVLGSGTASFLPYWTNYNTLGDSPIAYTPFNNKVAFLAPVSMGDTVSFQEWISLNSTLLAPDPNNPGAPTPGISGQVLSSTGTGVRWIDAPSGGGGVTSLNSLTGALDVIAGTGIIVTPSGSSITIEASGGGGGATDINGLTDGATDSFSTIALSDVNINGFSNTVKIGYNNLMNAISSANDVSIGYSAMSNWAGGSENVAIGSYAMEGDPSFPPSSTHSIAIGNGAMRYVSDVFGPLNDSIAIGWNSLRGSSSTLQMAGNRNIAIGSQALYEAGGALDNVAIGHNTMLGFGGQPIEGYNNVAIGPNTMTQPVFANDNIAIGAFAMGSFSGQDFDGIGNIAIGTNAASGVYGSGESNNTFIGYYSGNTANNGGLYNVSCFGAYSEPSTNSAQNEITLGDSSITTLRCNTQTIVGLSDARDKTGIKDLTYGLDFINLLTPREFIWNNRPEIRKVVDKETKKLIETEVRSSNVGVKDFGFIAQEVQVHDNELLNIVKDSNPDRLEMSYGKLVPILVNAIKELTARLEALEQ